MKKSFLKTAAPTKIARTFALACGVAAMSALTVSSARADVLEQKWQAGQQLSYDVKMDGTLRFTAPMEMAMIGGLPLELLLNGEGQSTLDTREIDEFGSALVVPRLEVMQLKFNETNFDQKGMLGFRDGKASLSLNGQNVGPNMDWSQASNPDYGLRITKSLRVLSAQPLKVEEAAATAEEKKPAGKSILPVDLPRLMQGMITRSIPPLLPAQDVEIGDTWTTNVEWPTVPGAPVTEKKAPAGKFDFKAVAEEEIAGRKTWRIAVDGVVTANDVSTKAASQRLEQRDDTKGVKLPKLLSMTQKMKGDVWFDAAAGQVVKVDMHLDTTAEGREAEGKAASGDMNFSGTMQLDLRKVSFSGAQ